MAKRVYNFGAGPATLPLPVLQRVQEELLDYRGIGASVIEISHRAPQFMELVNDTVVLFRELMDLPDNYRVLFSHGGGQMQFAAVPMNLIALKPARRALYVNSGMFAERSSLEAAKYGAVEVVADSKDTGYDRIPAFDPARLDQEASYCYIVTNNTVMGTRWPRFPDCGGLPLVGDATSDILSRRIDVSPFGLLFAGTQKNLGPAGLAVVIVREDLLGSALPETPKVLDYGMLAQDNSLTNTTNVFALYVTNLVLNWVKESGGVPAMEARNEQKAGLLYALLDNSGFYRPHARPEHRSFMNVTFDLPRPELTEKFVKEAHEEGLYKLKGHKGREGIRASLYNAMTLDGVRALVAFMEDFENRAG